MLELNINATQFTGIACFGAAALFALWAAKQSSPKKFWIGLAIFYAVLVLEAILSNRHLLTNLFRVILRQLDFYRSKEAIQIAMLACVAISFAFIVFALMRIWRSNQFPERVASLASAMLSGVFIIEIVSLHATDAILYRPVMGVLFIGYLWAACSLVVLMAAIARIALRKS
jgi:hypothetical protein